MSNHPLLIDNIAFAKRNEHLAGTLTLADCPRLAELIASQTQHASNPAGDSSDYHGSDVINFAIDGTVNVIGQPLLHLSIKAELMVYCQRCLERMPLNLNLTFNYLIAGEAAVDAEMDEDDDYDLQEPSQAMDLSTLIEDEIIMAMPIAPAHEDDCTKSAMQSGEKPNPFAVLKGLIKS